MTGTELSIDEILRALHQRLSKCRRNSPESAHISGLIGPITHLYRRKPINAIHEERLHDLLKRATALISNTPSA